MQIRGIGGCFHVSDSSDAATLVVVVAVAGIEVGH